jgi:hypothetical protein
VTRHATPDWSVNHVTHLFEVVGELVAELPTKARQPFLALLLRHRQLVDVLAQLLRGVYVRFVYPGRRHDALLVVQVDAFGSIQVLKSGGLHQLGHQAVPDRFQGVDVVSFRDNLQNVVETLGVLEGFDVNVGGDFLRFDVIDHVEVEEVGVGDDVDERFKN